MIIEIVEERRETAFCDHVALCVMRFRLNDYQGTWMAHLEKCSKRVVTEGLWETRPKRLTGPRIVTQPKVATNDVLEESDRLRLDELVNHVAKDSADGEKAFVGVTDIREASLVKEDLLHDENGNGLGEFRTGLHDAETEGDDLGGKKEMDYGVVVILLRREKGERIDQEATARGAYLDESTDDTEGCEAQVFERTCFGSCVQERIQEKGYMCCVFLGRCQSRAMTRESMKGSKYRSRTAVSSRDEMRRTGGARGRCRRD